MGSAQSARRIQPGGGSGRAGGPADLSRSPFLPTPPPALPPPLASPPASPRAGGGGGVAGVGGRGRGWGRRGTAPRPATGRRRAHFHRGGAPRPAPGRLGRPVGKVARGGPVVVVAGVVAVVAVVVVVVVVVAVVVVSAAGRRRRRRRRWRAGVGGVGVGGGGPTPPRVLQPPGSRARRIPGPREPDPSPRSPPSRRPPPRGALPARVAFPAGARRCPPGGPGRPSHGATALPPRLRLQPGGSGRGGLSPVRPGRVAPSGPGGAWFGGRGRVSAFPPPPPSRGHAVGRSERTGSAAMSATHPTRLETRTKESNTCASQGLARKPPWRNEGEGRPQPAAEVGSRGLSSPPRAHHRPVSPAAPGRWSMSARVRTRKMVNYAWAGRSQRKLWWRSVAVLTCKSVVRPGYRGERLIEPSSSWFPPKFPSG